MDATGDRETLGEFLSDFGSYSLGTIVPAVFGIAALVIFTRVFPPSAFGRYALTVAFAAVFTTVLFGWVQQSVLRFQTEVDPDTLATTMFSATAVLLLVGAVLGALGYVAFFAGTGAAAFFLVGVGLTLAQGPMRVFNALLQARLEAGRVMKYRIFNAVVKFGLALVLAIVVLESILGWVLAAVVGAGATALLVGYRVRPDRSGATIEWALCRRMLRFGGPMIVWMLGYTLLNFVDRGLLEWLRGSTAVGVYSSNYSIVARGLPLVLAPLVQTIHPLVMDAWSGDNAEAIEALVHRYTRYFLVVGVPATVLAGVASRPLSTLLLGAEYHPGASVIPIVAVGLFLWNLSMVGHKGLEVAERTAVMSAGVAVAVIVNVALNVPLIVSFGYHGAAVATMLSFGLYAGFVYLISRRYIRWRIPWRSVRNTAAGGTVLALVGAVPYLVVDYSLSITTAAGAVGSICYCGLLYGLGEFREEELHAARTALRSTKRWLV